MTIKTASVLAFERKLANSDALLYAGSWKKRTESDTWSPVIMKSKDVRGTISNRLKNALQSDPAKLDAEIQKPNLQRVDVAALPFDCDTLKVSFTLRVLGNLEKPSACNDQEYQQALAFVIKEYISTHNFLELARRYATNLANGRFLWRNRVGADAIEVHICCGDKKWIFDSTKLSMRSFETSDHQLAEVTEYVRKGLLGEEFILFKVDSYAQLGAGQEVFPSQELVLDSSRDAKKSKTLYQVDGVAAMHSQKIGNALRTIDTWYPEAGELGPIAIEPYGSVTSMGKAYRQPKQKMDFYTLLDGWVVNGKIPSVEQQHYVLATLIRGGVFGEKSE